MGWRFDPCQGLVQILAEVEGPQRRGYLKLALDTGATHSFIDREKLIDLGLEPGRSPNKTWVTTASGTEYVPVLTLPKLNALGQDHFDFPVTAVDLPASASVEGVIGLDFLRSHVLMIDFREGMIRLE